MIKQNQPLLSAFLDSFGFEYEFISATEKYKSGAFDSTLLRVLEKYATRMGGATNHRMGLWDAAMIKDNHVAVAGGVAEAVRRAREAGVERIILEVDSIAQIEPGLAAGASHLLLDNMDADTLRTAVALIAGRVPTEASGGVTLDSIRAKAETGVTYISVGRLTQSAPAADIGLDFAQA